MRTLSRYSKAKLEIASDPMVTPESLVTTPFFHTSEISMPHPTFMSAQPLESTLLPISGLHVANVHGAGMGPMTPGGGPLKDMYIIHTTGTGLVTAEVISVGDYGPFVETTLKIFDGSGMLLFASDDLTYKPSFPNMIFSTMAPIDTSFADGLEDDPLVLNMSLPPGFYFIDVSLDMDGVHAGSPAMTPLFYDLFVTSETKFTFMPEVPEPATFALVALPLIALALRRGAHGRFAAHGLRLCSARSAR
jgi:hypothetical protein